MQVLTNAVSGLEIASYSEKASTISVKCNDNVKASSMVNKLMETSSASGNLNLECSGVPWIVGKCKNIPRICAQCSSLCTINSNNMEQIYLGAYPLTCGFSEGCFQFMFVRYNSTQNEVISKFTSTEPVAVTSSSISIALTLSGPAIVVCSAYLELIDNSNPFSVSNRNITNSMNVTSVTISRYDNLIFLFLRS
jgi:hypothetical protein